MKAKETDEKKAQRLEEIVAHFKESGVIPSSSRRVKNQISIDENYGYYNYSDHKFQIGATFSRTFRTSLEASIGEKSAVELFKKKYIYKNLYGPTVHAYWVVVPTYQGSSITRADFFPPDIMGNKSEQHWRYKPDFPARYRQYSMVITLLSTEKISEVNPDSYIAERFLELREKYKAVNTENKLRAVARKAISEAIADETPKATARPAPVRKI